MKIVKLFQEFNAAALIVQLAWHTSVKYVEVNNYTHYIANLIV